MYKTRIFFLAFLLRFHIFVNQHVGDREHDPDAAQRMLSTANCNFFNNALVVTKLPSQSYFIIASHIFNLAGHLNMVTRNEYEKVNAQTKHRAPEMLSGNQV